jgi:hypothetical protein
MRKSLGQREGLDTKKVLRSFVNDWLLAALHEAGHCEVARHFGVQAVSSIWPNVEWSPADWVKQSAWRGQTQHFTTMMPRDVRRIVGIAGVVTKGLSQAAVHPACRWLLRMEGDQGTEGQTAYAIAMKDGSPFGIGGLWENWRDPTSGEWMRTFAIITTDANELVAEIHNRMPLILAPADYTRWLSDEPDPGDLTKQRLPSLASLPSFCTECGSKAPNSNGHQRRLLIRLHYI